MTEYKGKLFKGLFEKASHVYMSDGETSVESLLVNRTKNTSITGVEAEVKNSILIVTFAVSNITANQWNVLGTLPEGYRPKAHTYSTASCTEGTTALIYVSSGGEVQIRPRTSNTYHYGQIVSAL